MFLRDMLTLTLSGNDIMALAIPMMCVGGPGKNLPVTMKSKLVITLAA